jgi:DNA polymerase I-like protein with 3'-5' exonuclease and polymerase domains
MQSVHQQLALIRPPTSWTPPDLAALPSWRDAKRVAIDLETRDEQLRELGPGVRRGAYIVGVAFRIEDHGRGYYLPTAHLLGKNLDAAKVLGYLRDQAAHFSGEIVGANLPYEIDFLAEAGVEFAKVRRYLDVQVADPLINEHHRDYSLEAIGHRWVGVGKDEGLLEQAAKAYGIRDPKGGMWRLPAEYVGQYAEQDVALPLRVLRAQEAKIEKQDLHRIWDLESRVLPVLVRMTRRGVRVDTQRLDAVEQWSIAEERAALAQVAHHSGVALDVGQVTQPQAVLRVLKACGIQPGRTATGKPKIDKDLLEKSKHPACGAVRRAKQCNQLRSTFVEGIRKHMTRGRIHCSFKQLKGQDDAVTLSNGTKRAGAQRGPAYGRISAVNPNLQQQPARDPEIGPMWRAIYLPEEWGQWAADDYSQQEPRMAVHYAGLAKLGGAAAAVQMYCDNPDIDSHQMFADLTGLGRKDAKQTYLAITYGMGGKKFCHGMGLPTKWMHSRRRGELIEVAGEAGQAILDEFDRRAPFLRELAKMCERRANARGYLVTLGGRRCRFPLRKDGPGYDWTYKALNRLIQGSSADQTKQALVDLDAAGHYIQLQVHDEVDGTVRDRAEGEAIAHTMAHCMKLLVPTKVDVEMGPSWGEAN